MSLTKRPALNDFQIMVILNKINQGNIHNSFANLFYVLIKTRHNRSWFVTFKAAGRHCCDLYRAKLAFSHLFSWAELTGCWWYPNGKPPPHSLSALVSALHTVWQNTFDTCDFWKLLLFPWHAFKRMIHLVLSVLIPNAPGDLRLQKTSLGKHSVVLPKPNFLGCVLLKG